MSATRNPVSNQKLINSSSPFVFVNFVVVVPLAQGNIYSENRDMYCILSLFVH